MRMCVAAVIMFDLAIRLSDLEAFYTNTGAVPLSMLFEYSWNDYFISVHTMSGLWSVQLGLFLLAFFFAIMLFVGYRTRLFTILSWFMLLSLHNRNTLILQGGDDLLRLVLFWTMFIPWGKRYSCDSILEADPKPENEFVSVSAFAYLLQIVYIYTGSALLKGKEWDTDYTALYYAYSLDQITYPFSRLIYYYPELLRKLTFFVYYFELLVPLLFFIPVKHSFFRIAGVLCIIAFHTFNSFSLLIGLFPVIGIATIMGLLPTPFIDRAEILFKGLRKTAALSFKNYVSFIGRLVPWKYPRYLTNSPYRNIISAGLIFLIVFVFDWNFSNLSFVKSKLSNELRFIGYGLRLDQNWGMFAPGVFKDDGWFIMEGTDKNGNKIDLFRSGTAVNYKKPDYVVYLFKNDRWRKYTENYIFSNNHFMRGYFCNYSMRIWNEQNPNKQIDTLNVIYMKEFTLPDYQYSKPELNRLCNCVR